MDQSRDDIINGRDGDHHIAGKAGIDVVNGGPGSDALLGGFDGDLTNGGDGNDDLLSGCEDARDRCNDEEGDGCDEPRRG